MALYAAFDARTLLNKAGLHWLDGPTHVAVTTGAVQKPPLQPTKRRSKQRTTKADLDASAIFLFRLTMAPTLSLTGGL